MSVFEYMHKQGHEQVLIIQDKSAGLRGVIAIYDTTLGPAGGGTRRMVYNSFEEAIVDALNLSKAMAYKYAAAGVSCGGGKGVIIVNSPNEKSEELYRAYARFVDSLEGRFFTGMDVGTGIQELRWMIEETPYIFGLPETKKGAPEDWAPTSYGIMRGMEACIEEVYGVRSFQDIVVAIQGLGKVGMPLVRYLYERNVKKIFVSDVVEELVKYAVREFGCESVPPDKIYEVECDIFSPCALGGILNDETIPKLKCKIVAGGANNQLADEEKHDLLLYEKGILYAPDFVINAGQAVDDQDTAEPGGYNFQRAREKIDGIYDRIKQIIKISKEKKLPTQKCAYMYAEERIRKIRALKQVKLTKTRIPRW